VADHVLRSRDYVNVIVAGKQPGFDWLTLDQARAHCARGAGVWEWAGTEDGTREPDVVLACAGDVPTQETLAAAELLMTHTPDLRIRVVNVVDLMALLPENDHPHGYPDSHFDALFGTETDVVFAFHGYPRAVHQLVHGRSDPGRFHVRGFNEQGTTTTPFDMVVQNGMSRFHLATEALRRARRRVAGWDRLTGICRAELDRHHHHIREHLADLPAVAGWTWGDPWVSGTVDKGS
jgi:xylulose-5-phosphate/fructose-6-phosphate phosphoketolase